MLASSWKATGLVRAAWKRLDVQKGQRERLSELTGIPAPNLSGLNTGRLAMTAEMAERIAAVVPGITLLDLGAPVDQAGEEAATFQSRLEELEASLVESVRKQTMMALAIGRLQARVRRLEARPGPDEVQSVDP